MKKNQKNNAQFKKKSWYNRIKVGKNLQKTKTDIHTLPILVHRR